MEIAAPNFRKEANLIMHPSQWWTSKCGWKCGSLDSSDRQREIENDNHSKIQCDGAASLERQGALPMPS